MYSQLRELSDLLDPHDHVIIRQKVQLIEALTGGIFEQKNVYTVFCPDGEEILVGNERSNFTSRCLCNPLHSLTVELSRQGKVLYTAERPGLCCAKPCLCCCACTDHCTDTMTLHEGHAVGNPGELSAPSPILMVRQEKAYESPFSPALEVMPASEGEGEGFEPATMMINGPACFGGCTELCCESKWTISSKGTKASSGQIVKVTPENLGDLAREMTTDADVYRLEFRAMEADAKAALITSTLLLDYMFFEQDLGICKPTHSQDGCGCSTTLFNWYCCGCICPCGCSTGNNDSKHETN